MTDSRTTDSRTTHDIVCYRCGGALAELSLPLTRQDECPHCRVYLHVCKMCRHYDPGVPRQCREDDADDVIEKDRLNFCDYFDPHDAAFDPALKSASDAAEQQLAALFGDAEQPDTNDEASDAEKLFK